VNLFDGYQWVNQALNLVQKLLNGSEPIMLSAFYNSSLWSKGICYTVVWGFQTCKNYACKRFILHQWYSTFFVQSLSSGTCLKIAPYLKPSFVSKIIQC